MEGNKEKRENKRSGTAAGEGMTQQPSIRIQPLDKPGLLQVAAGHMPGRW